MSKKRSTGVYLLPSFFTVLSLFFGFRAIIQSIHGFWHGAAFSIVISMILDGLDGRIARLTNTTSEFGLELDSLADLVAFGVAPAVLIYSRFLEGYGKLGVGLAFFYVAAGALRLGRFNVTAKSGDNEGGDYFSGLPIPAAASVLISLILFTEKSDFDFPAVFGLHALRTLLPFLCILLAYLMVSNIHYPAFKHINLRKKFPFKIIVFLTVFFILILIKPFLTFFLAAFGYAFYCPFRRFFEIKKEKDVKDKNDF